MCLLVAVGSSGCRSCVGRPTGDAECWCRGKHVCRAPRLLRREPSTEGLSRHPRAAHGCPYWVQEEAKAMAACLPHLDLNPRPRGCLSALPESLGS